MRALLAPAALTLALLYGAPARASGGEHVVDDAAVETPGTCHLESWTTLSSRHSGLFNLAPACTRRLWPNLEIGGFFTHGWSGETADSVIGIAPKIALRSEERGIGIGIASSIGYGVGRGRIETASVIVPLTIPVGGRVRFNLNAGWQWSRSNGHNAFVGAQAEIAVASKLNLMLETFTRDQGRAGGQIGLRWTPGRGNIDVDLVGGRYVDGSTRDAITLGITMRR